MSAVLFAGTLASAAPALAAPKGPKNFKRRAVIRRAKTWTRARVPYSMTGYRRGYRRDCSGFVSMAWGLPENLVTWTVPLVAKRIKKRDLKPGDVLLNNSGGAGRHVVMFEKWANKKKTRYWVLEATGQNGVDRSIRRVVKYPYRIQGSRYKPYRYVGMKGYYRKVPKSFRQPVKNRAYFRKLRTQEAKRAKWRRTAKLRREAKREKWRRTAKLRRERRAAKLAEKRELKRLGNAPVAVAPASEAPAPHEPGSGTGERNVVAPEQQADGSPPNPMVMLIQQIAEWVTGQPNDR